FALLSVGNGPRPTGTAGQTLRLVAPGGGGRKGCFCGNRDSKSMKAATACPAGRLSADLYGRASPFATATSTWRRGALIRPCSGPDQRPACNRGIYNDYRTLQELLRPISRTVLALV